MMRNNVSRADLHVHSRHSNRPSEWFLRRIGAPESFTEPQSIYDCCRERGMGFVTITDHNSIAGALEIAHLPGTFLSSEITTYFPETDCKVHVVVAGIGETEFAEIQEIRPNIYEFSDYLWARDIVHYVAHPLYRVNDKLTPEEFEKLLLLFGRFEALNGARNPRANLVTRTIIEGLTPRLVAELEERHGIPARGTEPWRRFLTGGSDDHGGLYMADAFTQTPHATTTEAFLQHLRAGAHEPGGQSGSSFRLAQSIYQIAYSYYRDRFLDGADPDRTLIGGLLRNLSGRQSPKRGRRVRPVFVDRVLLAARRRRLSDVERILFHEFRQIAKPQRPASPPVRPEDAEPPTSEQRFQLACTIAHQLAFRFLKDTTERVRRGRIIDGLQSFSAVGPILLGVAPYITAFGVEHKDEGFLRSLAGRYPASRALRYRSGRRAWVTDTLSDVNGVAHTINMLSTLARRKGVDITVVTSLDEAPQVAFPLKNFEPVGAFRLPEYESQTLVFPPFLDMLGYFEQEGFDEIIISTPGPMGVAALGVAFLLRIPTQGIYHTDLPTYIGQLTDDDNMASLSWRSMRWFYGRMDTIVVQSRYYLEQLAARGLDRSLMRIMGKGVDLERFNPGRRERGFWRRYGLNGRFCFLYVGRVSREKNLEALLQAFLAYAETDGEASLAVVGEGPSLEELKRRFSHPRISFTGCLTGDRLAAAYASADVFVFPSMTDTYGNVVLEAHASGLPAIASDQGGPPEIVATHDSGLIIDMRNTGAIVEAMRRLAADRDLRDRLSRNALAKARESGWEGPLDVLIRGGEPGIAEESPAEGIEARPRAP